MQWAQRRAAKVVNSSNQSFLRRAESFLEQAVQKLGACIEVVWRKLLAKVGMKRVNDEFLTQDEYEEAENYRDKNSIELKLVYQKRQLDKVRQERKQAQRIAFAAAAVAFAALSAIAILGWVEADDAEKLAEERASLIERLRRINSDRNEVLQAIPIVENDPEHYVQLSQTTHRNSLENERKLREQWKEWHEPSTLKDTYDRLLGLHGDLRKDALVCLNQSLQSYLTRFTLPCGMQGNLQEVNSIAVSGNSTVIAAGCGDGKVRVWVFDGKNPTQVPKLLGAQRATTVNRVAFGGPNGDWLAAACDDAGVFIWFDPATSDEPLRIDDAPKGKMSPSWNDVAWSPATPTLLVAAANDNVADTGGLAWWTEKDRDVKLRLLLNSDGKPFGKVSAVTFGPKSDGRLFAADERGDIWSWGFANGIWKQAQSFYENKDDRYQTWNRLCSGMLTEYRDGSDDVADKRTVLIGSGEDKAAVVWNLQTTPQTKDGKSKDRVFADGERLITLQHPCSVRGAALSASGNLLITAGRDAKVRLWRFHKQRLGVLGPNVTWSAFDSDVRTLSGHTTKMTDICFGGDPGDTFMVSSADEDKVRLWNPLPRKGPMAYYGLLDFAYFSFSPDLETIVACDKVPIAATPFPILRRLQQSANWIDRSRPFVGAAEKPTRRVAFHPDGKHLTTLDEAGTLNFWEREQSTELAQLATNEKKQKVERPHFVLKDKIDAPSEQALKQLDLKPVDLLPPVYGQIVFGATGNLIAYSISKNNLWVYEIQEGRFSKKPICKIDKKQIDEWSKQCHASGGDKTVVSLDLSVYGFALDEAHQRLALACSKGVIFVVDLSFDKVGSARVIGELAGKEGPAVNWVDFSPDGNQIVAAYAEAPFIRVVDVASGGFVSNVGPSKDEYDQKDSSDRPVGKRGITSEATRVFFHPGKDGEIATGSNDGLLCVWKKSSVDGKSWDLVHQIGTESPVVALRYSQSGNKIGIVNSNGQVRVYWFNEDELLPIAAQRLTETTIQQQ